MPSKGCHKLTERMFDLSCRVLRQIMWDNGHHASPLFIIAFYGFCHLCTAATMFKELDMREAGDTYFMVSGV